MTDVGGGEIILEETKKQAKLKQVTLRGFNVKHTFAFKLHIEGKRLSDYLNPITAKINQGCNGIIFTYIYETWYALICELKSTKPKGEEYCSQFRNSEIFLNFIKLILAGYYQNIVLK